MRISQVTWPMGKLGRIAFRFTWNGLNTQLINLSGGSRREHNLILQFCKESIPERIILKHVQNTGDTYFASRCLISSKRCVGENSFIFVFIKIRNMIFVLFLTDTAFTAVTATYWRPPENLLIVRRQLLVHPRQFAIEVVYFSSLILSMESIVVSAPS